MASRDPADAIQAAVYAALTANAAVIAAFGGAPRVWDRVPLDSSGSVDTAKFPYITIGEDQLVGQTNQNTDPTEIFVKVEVWSRSTNKHEVKTIAGAVRTALDADIAMTGHGIVTHVFHGAIYRREPDGLTDRAIVTFRYQTVPVGLSPSN